MELRKYKLGEIAEIIPGYAFKSSDFGHGKNIAIKIKDIVPPGIDIKNADTVDVHPGERYQLQSGDYVMAMTGATIGKIGKIGNCEKRIFINQRVCKFIANNLCDKEYLYYVLNSDYFQKFVLNNIDSKLAQPNIGHPTLYKFENLYPTLLEQKRIASVLSNIDSKIELNRAINQNLEAMAKQLYDYWFVQFDYPDENGKPYKSSGGKMVWNEKLKREIPVDWEVLPLFDAVSVQYGFPFATEQFTEEETNVPVVRIRDILAGTTSAYSLEKADEKFHLNENDVLVGMDGNFHMNFWHDNIAYLNQRCVRLRAHSYSTISSIQILHSIKPYIKAKEQNAKGSTVGHLSDKDLKGLYLIKPLKTRAFNPRKTLDGLLALVIENKKQILSLTKQRDELLPLLMNCQVSVNSDLSDD